MLLTGSNAACHSGESFERSIIIFRAFSVRVTRS